MAPKSFKAVDVKGSAQASGHSEGATQVKNVSQISGKKIQSLSLNDVNNTKIKEKMAELVKEGLEKQNRNRLELKLKKSGSAQVFVSGKDDDIGVQGAVSGGKIGFKKLSNSTRDLSQDGAAAPLFLPSGVVVSPSVQAKFYSNSSQNQNINSMKVNINSGDMGGGEWELHPRLAS